MSLWQRRSLSIAGRITLIKFTLTTMPVHEVNAKIQRSFLWGDFVNGKVQNFDKKLMNCCANGNGHLDRQSYLEKEVMPRMMF